MRWFADLPIERKLRVVIIVPAAVAFLIAMGVHMSTEVMQFRKGVEERSTALARVIGAHSIAALRRSDPAEAEDSLRALQGDAFVNRADVLFPNGRTLASYRRAGEAPDGRP